MVMATADWAILILFVLGLLFAALKARPHAGSVSGFLAANRCAGRYLIAVSYGMAQLGVISLVWLWQQNYDVAYTSIWWGLMEGPAMIVIALSGWVVYRYRQTRAMTMAQFFEMRYSRRFRIFGGLVAFVAGIINYGIFPAVAARFFIALCGLPDYLIVGTWEVATFPVLMGALLLVALFFVFIGGQIAVIVTDFLQGSFANIIFLAVMAYLLWLIPWSQISEALLAAPEGKSLANPFDLGKEENFNIWYWVISVVVLFYGMLGWQGTSGYQAAAVNAHEAKMANILNGWRFRVLLLITLIVPLAIRVVMNNPEYAAQAEVIEAYTAAQSTDALAAEVRTPIAMAQILPVGLLGLFAAALFGAFISTNDTYLHSWGSIFIQDVVLPFRKKPLSQRAHLLLLKLSILGVAIFAFFFSLYFKSTQYIAMYLALTGAVFVGGAGSAIIGGLYWKRGTTAAAWTAMIVGMTLSGSGIVLKQLPEDIVHPGAVLHVEHGEQSLGIPLPTDDDWVGVPGTPIGLRVDLLEAGDGDTPAEASIGLTWEDQENQIATMTGHRSDLARGRFSLPDGSEATVTLKPKPGYAVVLRPLAFVQKELTGQELMFWSIASSISLYLLVSLFAWLLGKEPHDMDQLLHRGKYAVQGDKAEVVSKGSWLERLGFDKEMTRWDRFTTFITLLWPFGFTIVFIVITVYAVKYGLSTEWWVGYWHWWTWFTFAVAALVTLWFTIGGFRDLLRMFRRLRTYIADEQDDGRVG